MEWNQEFESKHIAFFALSTLFVDVRAVSLITQEGKELVGKATPLTHHLTSIASILSFPVSLLLSYLFYPLALSMFPGLSISL